MLVEPRGNLSLGLLTASPLAIILKDSSTESIAIFISMILFTSDSVKYNAIINYKIYINDSKAHARFLIL